MISEKTLSILYKMQCNELTESLIYSKIASCVKDENNRSILLKISEEEKAHAEVWKTYTKKEGKANMGKVRWLSFISKILGFTFVLKKMENGEDMANAAYSTLISEVPEAKQISEDEDKHEQSLLAMLDEERLQYVGSMVLGLSDALVELSGTLAGLTFALQNTRLIALSGLITGISATLSMASSEYLSAKADGDENAKKSCLYTGVAYLFTVACMVLPYLLMSNFIGALIVMLTIVVMIILGFTYYISVAKSLPFRKRFLEMAGISLSVAAISFVIGILVKKFLGIDI